LNDYPLSILAGATALEQLKQNGWQPQMFSTLVGASGGAKLLGLGHLDRFIMGDYLLRSDQPMDLYGSSIGSWRHAALASENPLETTRSLQDRYLSQMWDEADPRTPTEIIDGLCEWVLDGIITQENVKSITSHPRFRTHIVVAKGLGLNGSNSRARLAVGMGASALSNIASRKLLANGFQRTVFSSGPSEGFRFQDFNTEHVLLSPENLKPALLASGSIPFLMSGQRDIAGAPPGQYWDGGIIDYHFDFTNCHADALVLYPHFMNQTTKGWFDKKLPWRKNNAESLHNVVLVSPSPAYVARLPLGKIPDRKDFQTMRQEERLKYWRVVIERSQELANAFSDVVSASNPLERVQCIA
jgi:hypothetical protein